VKKIFLILISINIVLFADFIRNSTGIVTDNNTKLQWQDNYGLASNGIEKASWLGAINYCKNLKLDGGGWKLPNRNELLSIVDYKKYDPSIDKYVFKKTVSDDYWTSTTHAYRPSGAWIVNFYDGNSVYGDKSIYYYVRCVRSKR